MSQVQSPVKSFQSMFAGGVLAAIATISSSDAALANPSTYMQMPAEARTAPLSVVVGATQKGSMTGLAVEKAWDDFNSVPTKIVAQISTTAKASMQKPLYNAYGNTTLNGKPVPAASLAMSGPSGVS